jgi:peroxiredoxin
MIKQFLFLFASVSVLIIAGCSQSNSFRVNGTLKGKENKYIYVYRVDVNSSEKIDSTKINKQGNFTFRIKSIESDYYQLGLSATEFITLLAGPGEKINVDFDGKDLFGNYNITGSVGSQQVKMLDSTLLVTKIKLDSIRTEYNNLVNSPDFNVKGPQLDKAFSDLVVNQRKYNIAFILQNMSSLASIKAVYQKINDDSYVLYEPRDLQFLKIVSDSLSVHYPDSRHTIALKEYFRVELNKFNLNLITEKAMNATPITLNPTLKDVNGRRVSLSSIKGKYVLLSFWSTQSQVCVEENLLLKQLYNSYSRKGFEIYQINIDSDEAIWKTAVKFDELPWISVREDSTSAMANYQLYNVTSLPANYLYDRNGEIIGKDLNSSALNMRLQALLGN